MYAIRWLLGLLFILSISRSLNADKDGASTEKKDSAGPAETGDASKAQKDGASNEEKNAPVQLTQHDVDIENERNKGLPFRYLTLNTRISTSSNDLNTWRSLPLISSAHLGQMLGTFPCDTTLKVTLFRFGYPGAIDDKRKTICLFQDELDANIFDSVLKLETSLAYNGNVPAMIVESFLECRDRYFGNADQNFGTI